MKNLLLIILSLFLVGCAACPKTNKILWHPSKPGCQFTVPKGFFDNPDATKSQREFLDWLEKWIEEYEEKRLGDAL